ncbi:heat-inducible transcriptional repressor HrcA [Propioniciclava flava]|uniref:Heat-inducible transcription repressor HrcA n=1 Tax=Propioniciclava flava TaxID=2072026 RepID=A0A4Q2ECX0_9ACTN|nr:heat-inducible transcriptional repressor HrcA [Propioniciclava flava]RXW31257.1 heat-inducible transcriptional repressor HrcA [Propioniciclava flava]
MDDRKLTILKAIVTDYVSSREPVGSQALVQRHNLQVSPATVRNDMAALEDEGYITQPHTSAGRIPTDKGYRLFVDRLSTVKPLSVAERRAIQTFMEGALDVEEIVRRSVALLANVTRQVAIVQYPLFSSATIRHVDVLALGAGRGLVMVVSSSGTIGQRFVPLTDSDEQQVSRIRGRIAEQILDLTHRDAAGRLAVGEDAAESSTADLSGPILDAVRDIVSEEADARVAVAGVPNLTRFGDQYETTVKPMLEALEEQVVLLHLLGESASNDVRVRIGRENPYEPFQAASVVASGYGDDATSWGSLGVMGPTRMDYPAAIASVRAVARYVGRFLAEG